MSKMRILTFLTLASQQSEIAYSDLTDLMAINEDDIEEFIIGRECRNYFHVDSCFLGHTNTYQVKAAFFYQLAYY